MIDVLARRPQRRRRTSRGGLSRSPLLVVFEVTRSCGLAQTEHDPVELSTDQARQLIHQLNEFPTRPRLMLTGGDPLERSDLVQLVEHAARSGIDVSLTAAATPLATRQAIRRLRNAGLARMAISLDGADAISHDALQGVEGSFRRSLRILSDARDAGIPTQVNTTLTPANVDQIEKLADLLARLEVVAWSLLFPVPLEGGTQLTRLNGTQCESAFARIWREAQRQPYAVHATEAPHYRRYAIQHQLSQSMRPHHSPEPTAYVPIGPNDGKGVMFVSHAGLVYPSGLLPILCGVFPRQHVVQIYQESPIFRALRDTERLEGKCHVCEFRHLCGGSRARAYAVTGNLFAQEPDCVYVPEALSFTGGNAS